MNLSVLEREYDQAHTEHLAAMAKASENAEAAGRNGCAWSAADSSAVTRATTAMSTAKTLLTEARAKGDKAKADGDTFAALDRLTGGSGYRAGSPFGGGRPSLGREFVDSEPGRWLVENRHKFPSGVAWTSPTSVELSASTLTSDSASGGSLIVTDTQPGILPMPTRRLVLADLLADGVTDSNSVTYMQETAFINAAAAVLEAGMKPESTLVFDSVTEAVKKIAHWLPVTEEMLSDVAALSSYIDARLRLGVQLVEDFQLLNGDGLGANLSGLLSRAGLAPAIPRGTDTNADAVLRQIAAIFNSTGLQPDGVVMNPSDWLSIQLLKTDSGEYIAGNGPFSAPQTPTLWGVPVALTPAITAGTALVGCFKTAAQIFRKGGLRVEASNSHADFFVRNLLAIRSEERLALAVYRPSAFGRVTGLV